MNLFARNSSYYHLLKYLLFLLKHPVYVCGHLLFRNLPISDDRHRNSCMPLINVWLSLSWFSWSLCLLNRYCTELLIEFPRKLTVVQLLISGQRQGVIWTDMVSKAFFKEHLIKINVYYSVHCLQAIKCSNQLFADNEQCKSPVSIQPFINLSDNLFNDVCPNSFDLVWDKAFTTWKTRSKAVMQILCALRWCIKEKSHKLCSKHLSEGC
jgi:hypothetical protein